MPEGPYPERVSADSRGSKDVAEETMVSLDECHGQ